MNSSVINKLGRFFPFLKRPPLRSAQEALLLKPVRAASAEWRRNEKTGFVVVTYRRDSKGSFDRLVGRLFRIDTRRRIEMTDELSSLVWEMCDGANSVGSIAARISVDYKLTRRQAQVSVLAFLNTLEKKSLIRAIASRKNGSPSPKPGPKGNSRSAEDKKRGTIHARRK